MIIDTLKRWTQVMRSKHAMILMLCMISACIASINFYTTTTGIQGKAISTSINLGGCVPSNVFGSSNPTTDEWPMFHYNLTHAGLTTTTPVQAPGPIWICNQSWGFPLLSSPAISGGRVFYGDAHYNLCCLNETTGESIWNYTTGNPITSSSPAVSGGRVYIGSNDGSVYCVDAATHALYWATATGAGIGSSPAVSGNRVYIGSGDNKLYCLDAITGAVAWSKKTGGQIIGSLPAIWGNYLYIGGSDHKIHCYRADTGQPLWNYTTANQIIDSPTIADGFLFVGGGDPQVYCLNATTGTSFWNFTTSSYYQSTPAVWDGKVYIGCRNDKVYCIDELGGFQIWSYTTLGFVYSSPAVVNGLVYVGSDDGRMYCLNATKGRLIWNYNTGSSVEAGPAIAQGCVFFGTTGGFGGKLYCLPMNLVPLSPLNVQGIGGTMLNTITWQPPLNFTYFNHYNTPVTGYKIYRGTVQGGESAYATIANITTFTDFGVQPGFQYYYRVSAMSTMGVGQQSPEVNAMPVGVPSAPRALQASVKSGGVSLSWLAPSNPGGMSITNYTIYRSTLTGGEILLATIGNVTTFTDSSVTNGQAYYYTVCAVNGIGNGPRSSEVLVQPGTTDTATLAVGVAIAAIVIAAFTSLIALDLFLKQKKLARDLSALKSDRSRDASSVPKKSKAADA